VKHKNIFSIVAVVIVIGTIFLVRGQKVSLGIERDLSGYQFVKSDYEVFQAYPLTVEEIKARYEDVLKVMNEGIDAITELPATERNKETVVRAFDKTMGYASTLFGGLELIHMVSPDKAIREQGAHYIQELQKQYAEKIMGNKKLYQALKEYLETQADHDNLTKEERYFLEETVEDFKRAGLELPDQELAKVIEINKKLSQLGTQFQMNINGDNRTLEVTAEQLKGVPESFIKTLKKTEDSKYVLRSDYPTQDVIMRECSVSDTRKLFSKMMSQKGYPQNVEILQEVIKLNKELATLLGFESYADLALADQMMKTPQAAWKLQNDLLPQALKKAKEEIERYKEDLPEGVQLTQDGKFQPWDLGYTVDQFKKKHYQIDEAQLAEYFPMEETVQGLFAIYQKFFDLKFETIKNVKAWHCDVRLLKVYKKDGTLLGYIYLDMFPRENKYGHAAKFSCVAARKALDKTYYPAVCTVVCNFTPPTSDKPSLLKYNEVNTFFHEFGHALHCLMGGTLLSSQSGTHVKRDFVEMPSQMLENWMEDKEILLGLGKHYKTGKTIPADLIDKKLELLKMSSGYFECRQLGLGMISLDIYDPSGKKDLDGVIKKYYEETMPFVAFDPDNKMYSSFGHLIGYGPKYYGYLWARILGADIFEAIEKEGLLNPAAGKKYAQAILEPGGSQDPADLVRNYLGREPNQEAFLKKNGFK
jgi:thimet oligopeptidase